MNEEDVKVEEMSAPTAKIGSEQVKEFMSILQKYKTGKVNQDRRVIEAEEWWKLHNVNEEKRTNDRDPRGFKTKSGWLHNVIVSKHADAMKGYPEPTVLPREPNDRQQATTLSSIIPCILEQNHFEQCYSDVQWAKLKTGTGVYKVVWDSQKLNGLGDVSVEKANLLNLYWEPGITDIQKSRYFFHTELVDIEMVEQQYPEVHGKLKGNSFMSAKFLYDDTVSTDGKTTVIDVYYHTYDGGKSILQYCKFVEDVVLYATENETEGEYSEMGIQTKMPMSMTGLYDHGLYPYVFDTLYPIEGSPCGYGYVDLCKSAQTEIDIMGTAMLENAMAVATPRFFVRDSDGINEEELLDLKNKIVHIPDTSDGNIRDISPQLFNSNYVTYLQHKIQELRETAGNNETATGAVPSGIAAASAVVALQEASGKSSVDSSQTAYRAYSKIVELVIELIRQFYDAPRSFRITGKMGDEQFTTYDNAGIQPEPLGNDFGIDMGMRTPMFDIKVGAQKASTYTRVSQNELALQFFQLGFFNPQNSDMVLATLDMMDFDGKEEVIQKVARNGTLYQQLIQWQQLALTLANQFAPQMVPGLAQSITGQSMAPGMGGGDLANLNTSDTGDGGIFAPENENTMVANARKNAQDSGQVEGGEVIRKR